MAPIRWSSALPPVARQPQSRKIVTPSGAFWRRVLQFGVRRRRPTVPLTASGRVPTASGVDAGGPWACPRPVHGDGRRSCRPPVGLRRTRPRRPPPQAHEPAAGEVLGQRAGRGHQGRRVGPGPATAVEHHGPRTQRVDPDPLASQLDGEGTPRVGSRRPSRRRTTTRPRLPAADRPDHRRGSVTGGRQPRHGCSDRCGGVDHVDVPVVYVQSSAVEVCRPPPRSHRRWRRRGRGRPARSRPRTTETSSCAVSVTSTT